MTIFIRYMQNVYRLKLQQRVYSNNSARCSSAQKYNVQFVLCYYSLDDPEFYTQMKVVDTRTHNASSISIGEDCLRAWLLLSELLGRILSSPKSFDYSAPE